MARGDLADRRRASSISPSAVATQTSSRVRERFEDISDLLQAGRERAVDLVLDRVLSA